LPADPLRAFLVRWLFLPLPIANDALIVRYLFAPVRLALMFACFRHLPFPPTVYRLNRLWQALFRARAEGT
jgi:hypothetical protein